MKPLRDLGISDPDGLRSDEQERTPATVRRAMKISRTATVLALVSCAILVMVVLEWPKDRESRASAPLAPAEVEERRQPEAALVAAAAPEPDREELPAFGVVEEPFPSDVPPSTFHYVFLPDELQPLATVVPERLKKFDDATPAEQLQLGRDLLVHSIAVILCATDAGPIPKGAAGDGDLSHTGRDGKWSFQINSSTFHFNEREFPEYPEYMTLLNSAYDDQMVPLATTVELPAHLAERIRRRAQEALGWL
jgi:hypothetical protein